MIYLSLPTMLRLQAVCCMDATFSGEHIAFKFVIPDGAMRSTESYQITRHLNQDHNMNIHALNLISYKHII
jgi:hypothetical protein